MSTQSKPVPEWVIRSGDQTRIGFGAALCDMLQADERVVAISADTIDLLGPAGRLGARFSSRHRGRHRRTKRDGYRQRTCNNWTASVRVRLRALYHGSVDGAAT